MVEPFPAVQVALVTGASRGIGRSIALRLSNDGYAVALNDIASQAKQLEELQVEIVKDGGRALAYIADVSVEAEVEGMIAKVAGDMGGLDVMVANAGVLVTKTFLDTSLEDLQRVLSVNVCGTFLCYKYAAQQMVKQGRGGRIIGASSIAGKQGWPFLSAYSTSKFAIRGLTQSAAAELGKHGITVNAYAPGPIDTQMIRDLRESVQRITGGDPEAEGKDTGALAGDGTTEDIAGLVGYLVSPDARFVTGQSISVNGGRFFD